MNYTYWITGLVVVLLVGWILLSPSMGDRTQEVMVYFAKSEPTEIVTVGVARTIKSSNNPGILIQKTLGQLLAGPTSEEQNQGLHSAINKASKVNYIKINGTVATVDFNDQFDFQVGGSATVLAIRQQLEKTVLQFDFVDQLVLTVNNGQRQAILEP